MQDDDDLISDGSAATDEEDHGETGHRRMSEGTVEEIEKDEQKLGADVEDLDEDDVDEETDDEDGEDDDAEPDFDAEDDEDE